MECYALNVFIRTENTDMHKSLYASYYYFMFLVNLFLKLHLHSNSILSSAWNTSWPDNAIYSQF